VYKKSDFKVSAVNVPLHIVQQTGRATIDSGSAVAAGLDLSFLYTPGRRIEEFAANPKMVGVRHVIHDEADDEFMLRPDFQRGIAALEPAGLAYDILIFPRHLSAAITLVDRFPNQRFVIDHIAKPNIAAGALDPWAGLIRELARRENVFCKLSGMVTEADVSAWRPADFAPYIDVVLEAFGPSRLMIGSDWPVCTLGGSYEAVMRIVLDAVGRLGRAEQDAICGGTCRRFYQL
jgi:L-fuconolactonase